MQQAVEQGYVAAAAAAAAHRARLARSPSPGPGHPAAGPDALASQLQQQQQVLLRGGASPLASPQAAAAGYAAGGLTGQWPPKGCLHDLGSRRRGGRRGGSCAALLRSRQRGDRGRDEKT